MTENVRKALNTIDGELSDLRTKWMEAPEGEKAPLMDEIDFRLDARLEVMKLRDAQNKQEILLLCDKK